MEALAEPREASAGNMADGYLGGGKAGSDDSVRGEASRFTSAEATPNSRQRPQTEPKGREQVLIVIRQLPR